MLSTLAAIFPTTKLICASAIFNDIEQLKAQGINN